MTQHFRCTGWLAFASGILAGGLAACLTMASPAPARQRDDKDKKSKENVTTKIHLQVTAGEENRPVDNASVYVRFEQGRRHKLVEMNLKTNQDGSVKVPEVPRGKILIQVVATGWKTFGQWYVLEKEEETIKIKLEKPPRWY